MFSKTIVACLCAAALSGCAGLSQVQGSIATFDQGAQDLARTQDRFWDAIRAADCNLQLQQATLVFVQAQKQGDLRVPAPLAPACTPTILSDDQIALRKNLTAAIVLYADKLQALSADDSDTGLTANGEATAAKIKAAAPALEGQGSGIGAALIALAEAGLDRQRFRDLKSAAVATDPSLTVVVERLKSENTALLEGLKSKSDGNEQTIRLLLALTTPARTAPSLSDLEAARRMTHDAVRPISDAQVASLNDALDALVAADRSVAQSGKASLRASVKDLIARVRAAHAVKSDLDAQ